MDGAESSQPNLLWPLDTFYYKVLNKKDSSLTSFQEISSELWSKFYKIALTNEKMKMQLLLYE